MVFDTNGKIWSETEGFGFNRAEIDATYFQTPVFIVSLVRIVN